MKTRNYRSKGVVKGTASGIILSVIVHLAAFIIAGLLIVFTVYPKQERRFKPPAVTERPKMRLKKPQVRLKKSGRPRSPDRIVTTVVHDEVPKIQLPAIGGIGDGLGDGFGDGFGLIPNIDDLTMLGSSKSIGNDLVGTYYDLKFSRSGKYNPVTIAEYRHIFNQVFRNGFDTKILQRFYRSPKKLYATYLLLPPSISAMAPVAFGMSDDKASGGLWIVHYKGKLVHKDGITFRFWVAPDDSLAIRVDGEVVVAASYTDRSAGGSRALLMYQSQWETSSLDSFKYQMGHSLATVGDWITLEPGVAKDIEIIAGDNEYQNASFVVAIQEKDKEYPRNQYNGPLLPIFRTEELTHDQLDIIYEGMPDNVVDCISGPVFRDF